MQIANDGEQIYFAACLYCSAGCEIVKATQLAKKSICCSIVSV